MKIDFRKEPHKRKIKTKRQRMLKENTATDVGYMHTTTKYTDEYDNMHGETINCKYLILVCVTLTRLLLMQHLGLLTDPKLDRPI